MPETGDVPPEILAPSHNECARQSGHAPGRDTAKSGDASVAPVRTWYRHIFVGARRWAGAKDGSQVPAVHRPVLSGPETGRITHSKVSAPTRAARPVSPYLNSRRQRPSGLARPGSSPGAFL